LSEQITEVEPRVSTECNRLTMAFSLAIWAMPTARVTVTTAGRPSGMAATASATAPSIASRNEPSSAHWVMNTTVAATPAMIARR